MWIFGRKGASGFSTSSTAEQVTQDIDASALTAIITGASSGIGTETTRVLALRGVHVIMAVRNVDSGKKVKETIIKDVPNARIDVMELDLSCMTSVRKFASDYNSLDLPLNLLINNAGVLTSSFILSNDHMELQFATNHLGHYLLTNLLLDNMKKTARDSQKEGRIVNVSSEGYQLAHPEGICFEKINDSSSYNKFRAYGQSKLANILHANELTRRFKEEGVQITANSLHPGVIATNLLRHLGFFAGIFNWFCKYVTKSIPQGAATTCYVALHPHVTRVSGKYFADSNIFKTTSVARDEELAKKLWDFSFKATLSNSTSLSS